MRVTGFNPGNIPQLYCAILTGAGKLGFVMPESNGENFIGVSI